MSNETILILIVLLIVVLLIFFMMIRFQRSILHQINESEKNRIKENTEFRDKVNLDLINFQNTINSSMKEDFNRLNDTTVNRLVTI